jgi:Skp family chaperone for outer membrane proteins
MKKIMLVLALGFFLSAILAGAGFAQGNKIAVFNAQELENSVEGKKVIDRLRERDKKNQTDLARLDGEISQLETRLNTQRLTLSDEAALQLNSDLDKKRKERQRFAEDAVRDIQELQYRLVSKLESEVLPIIAQLGKERGYDMILDKTKSGVIFFSPAIDITPEVIKRYDASKAAAPAPK